MTKASDFADKKRAAKKLADNAAAAAEVKAGRAKPEPQVPSALPQPDTNPSQAKRQGFRGEETHSVEEAAREMITGGPVFNETAVEPAVEPQVESEKEAP